MNKNNRKPPPKIHRPQRDGNAQRNPVWKPLGWSVLAILVGILLITGTLKLTKINLGFAEFGVNAPAPTATLTPSPAPTSTPIVAHVSVFSENYPFKSTGITVHTGDKMEFSVDGQWDCGRGTVTPEGYDERYSNTVSPSERVCSLIGAIFDSDKPPDKNFDGYFFIGEHQTKAATSTGKLYLGCNDSVEVSPDNPEERFIGNPTSSKLEVTIVISH